MITKILEKRYDSEENSYLIEDYPWGFRMRTEKRCWIETTKFGDRYCAQTKDPRTGKWCKPKKSTYSAVMVMGLDEEGHVKYTGFSLGWDNEEKIKKFIEKAGGIEKFSDMQKKNIQKGIAISRTQENVEFVIDRAPRRTEEEQKKHDEEQKKIKENIGKQYAYNYYKVGKEI